MAKKIPSLEDFIKEYIKNKDIAMKKESYADWITERGVDLPRVSSVAQKTNTNLLKSGSGYGASGETLSNNGLSRSGYADYLAASRKRAVTERDSDARSDMEQAERLTLSGYASYLDNYKRELGSLRVDVEKTLERDSIIDFDLAYEYAVEKGLPHKEASAAAKTATERTRTRLYDTVLSAIVDENLTDSEAREYATKLGLSESDAAELAKFAYEKNQKTDQFDSGYAEDLKNKADELIESMKKKKG